MHAFDRTTNPPKMRSESSPSEEKNFLFVHREEAGKELALLYSLVISCTRVGVNPVEYLADVLARIDKTADADLPDLLPHRWKPPRGPTATTIFDA